MVNFIRLIQPNHLITLMLNRDLCSQSVCLRERIHPHRKGSSSGWHGSSTHHGGIPHWWLGLPLLTKGLIVVRLLMCHCGLLLGNDEGRSVLLNRLISHEVEIVLLLVVFSTGSCCRHSGIRILTVRSIEHGTSLTLLRIGKRIRRIHTSCHIWKIF